MEILNTLFKMLLTIIKELYNSYKNFGHYLLNSNPQLDFLNSLVTLLNKKIDNFFITNFFCSNVLTNSFYLADEVKDRDDTNMLITVILLTVTITGIICLLFYKPDGSIHKTIQLDFQDPATPIAEGIIDFHHDLIFLLLIISGIVFYALFEIILINRSHINEIPATTIEHQLLEIIWTVIPIIILMLIALPSYALLYSLEELKNPVITTKVIGHQWYWTYEFHDKIKEFKDFFTFYNDFLKIFKVSTNNNNNNEILLYNLLSQNLNSLSSDFVNIWISIFKNIPTIQTQNIEDINNLIEVFKIHNNINLNKLTENEIYFILSFLNEFHQNDKNFDNSENWMFIQETIKIIFLNNFNKQITDNMFKDIKEAFYLFMFINDIITPVKKTSFEHLNNDYFTNHISNNSIDFINDYIFYENEKENDNSLIENRHISTAANLDFVANLIQKDNCNTNTCNIEIPTLNQMLLKEYLDTFIISLLEKKQTNTINYYNIFFKKSFNLINKNFNIFEANRKGIKFDSYILNDLNLIKGSYRLLEVDLPIVFGIKQHIRLLITSSDVLHSFAVPALGIKMDACPGRLNQLEFFLRRKGRFYGQCSEICGVNHSFMPITVLGIEYNDFKQYLMNFSEKKLYI